MGRKNNSGGRTGSSTNIDPYEFLVLGLRSFHGVEVTCGQAEHSIPAAKKGRSGLVINVRLALIKLDRMSLSVSPSDERRTLSKRSL